MTDLVLALDVGGTNTRTRIAALTRGGERGATATVRDDIVIQSTSASDLYAHVEDTVRETRTYGQVTAAAVAVAGPVVRSRSRLTNWHSDDALVELGALESAGLPAGRTHLVNDVVAGAWGALARLDSPAHAQGIRTLSGAGKTAGEPGLADGSLVYLAPGTGLGAAALIRHGEGPLGATAVGCESQHTRMPRFDEETARTVEVIERALGRPPSWEDLVSGRGLVHIYEASCALASAEPLVIGGDDAKRAGAIAAKALASEDDRAATAVGIFYRTLARFAQTLALSYLPCAAVVFGGASTERNLPLVRESGLTVTFAEHERFADLLGSLPLYAVGGEVNLEGGVWLAARS
ncbi:MAG: glucokinase [Anaerosomatales bacterium]|nr:glucokinase [Anaerosomatales bacterium]MDT8434593.1 glucokinase [Anaerosomatales bacterium]